MKLEILVNDVVDLSVEVRNEEDAIKLLYLIDKFDEGHRFILDGEFEFTGCPPYGPDNLTICLVPIG